MNVACVRLGLRVTRLSQEHMYLSPPSHTHLSHLLPTPPSDTCPPHLPPAPNPHTYPPHLPPTQLCVRSDISRSAFRIGVVVCGGTHWTALMRPESLPCFSASSSRLSPM